MEICQITLLMQLHDTCLLWEWEQYYENPLLASRVSLHVH